jgi:CheY-like chemotaxis protein
MIRNVLLIDYDPRSIRRLRDLMQGAGFQTLLATNGNAGVDANRLCRPDLVVVQDLLPGLHGFEVCKSIKAAGNGSASPVVLLYSPRPGRRGLARSCGCDAVLEKPFEDPAFLSLVRSLLPAIEAPSGDPIAPVEDLGEADPEIEVAIDHLFGSSEFERSAKPSPAPEGDTAHSNAADATPEDNSGIDEKPPSRPVGREPGDAIEQDAVNADEGRSAQSTKPAPASRRKRGKRKTSPSKRPRRSKRSKKEETDKPAASSPGSAEETSP